MKRSVSGRKSLRKYEVTNLIFFLSIITALVIFVSFVFYFYGRPDKFPTQEADENVILSEAVSSESDVGLIYLGIKLSETSLQYRSRLEIPATDDGLGKQLFAIPGIEGIVIDQKLIMINKSSSATWESILPAVREVIKNHLHLHY